MDTTFLTQGPRRTIHVSKWAENGLNTKPLDAHANGRSCHPLPTRQSLESDKRRASDQPKSLPTYYLSLEGS